MIRTLQDHGGIADVRMHAERWQLDGHHSVAARFQVSRCPARHISAADSGGSRAMSFTISSNGEPVKEVSSTRHRRCETRGWPATAGERGHPEPRQPPWLQPSGEGLSSHREPRPGPGPVSTGRRGSGTCRSLPRACAALGDSRPRAPSPVTARFSSTFDTPTKAWAREKHGNDLIRTVAIDGESRSLHVGTNPYLHVSRAVRRPAIKAGDRPFPLAALHCERATRVQPVESRPPI